MAGRGLAAPGVVRLSRAELSEAWRSGALQGKDMTKTNRITVNFSEGATEWLNQEAKRRNLSVSELIRRIVDELRGDTIIRSKAS
jgi:hypothetical protein